jgi:GNAT superfamily N-acetyltransferase
MELAKLNKRELLEYVDSDQFQEEEVVPISRQRALSQISNPRAEDEDVLLIVLTENKRLCGYLGILPDRIFLSQEDDGQSIHFGWLSCIWVHPDFQGRGIARKMLNEAIQSWKGMLMGTEFVPGLDQFYRSSGSFSYTFCVQGVRMYFGSTLADWVPRKIPALKSFLPVLKWTDDTCNWIWDFMRPKMKATGYQVKPLQQFTTKHELFLRGYIGKSLFQRSVEEFNWILQHPWVLDALEPNACEPRYHFTSCAKNFTTTAFELCNNEDQTKAIVLILRRGIYLSIPYLFVSDDEAGSELSNFINEYIHSNGIRVLKIFQKEIRNKIQKEMKGSLFSRETKREFVCSDALKNFVSGREDLICDGDGDCSFT